jgi:hypothetical protein
MSYATYNGSSNIHPNHMVTFNIHTNKDEIKDNSTLVRKMRIVRGAQIRNQRMWSTVATPFTPATTDMPFMGNLVITIGGALAIDFDITTVSPATIIVRNPFVNSSTSVVISNVNANGGTATVSLLRAVAGQGQITIAGTSGIATSINVSGSLTISAGRQTN